jgi:hypothetical protein
MSVAVLLIAGRILRILLRRDIEEKEGGREEEK